MESWAHTVLQPNETTASLTNINKMPVTIAQKTLGISKPKGTCYLGE